MEDERRQCDPDGDTYVYLKQKHPHPKDGLVRFDEASHTYKIRIGNDEWIESHILSVTKFLDKFVPEFPSHIAFVTMKSVNKRFAYWYKNRDKLADPESYAPEFFGPIWPEKYYRYVPRHVFVQILRNEPIPDEERLKLPEPLGRYTAQSVRDSWVRPGKELHDQIDRFLNRMPSPTPDTKVWRQFMCFIAEAERRGYTPIRTEMSVALPSARLAGRFDLVMRRSKDKKMEMFDYKTTDKIKQKPELDLDYAKAGQMNPPFEMLRATSRNKYMLQQNLYSLFLAREYGILLEGMWLVIFHETNPGFMLIRVQDISKDPILRDAMNRALSMRMAELEKLLSQEEVTTEYTVNA